MAAAASSFEERYLSRSSPPPLSPGDVRRLAFEGGGGKGNAYLGALFALDQLEVLPHVDTVAGSSAGAITALALSLGMRPHEVFAFMNTTDFGKFFDEESDKVPVPRAPYVAQPSPDRAVAVATWATVVRAAEFVAGATDALRKVVDGRAGSAVLTAILRQLYRVEDVAYAIAGLQLDRGPVTFAAGPPPDTLTARVLGQLLRSLPRYLTSLSHEMGIFSGEAARDRFAALIADRMAGVDLSSASSRPGARVNGRSVTFAQLDRFASAHKYPLLRVTGSELCALRTVIFSGATTPNFPVADAVRISMGLPFVYKPYSIKSTGRGLPPCGVYVDGGVFANLPLLAFSDREATNAIGLRLEIDVPTRIDGFLGFLTHVAQASLLAGESSVVTSRADRSVRLDTDPLGLFDFTVDPDKLAIVSARAHLTTMLYFGQGADYAPIDLKTGEALPEPEASKQAKLVWKDLEASVNRRRQASGCVFDSQSRP